jgi:serine/threonine-protein kinase
MSPQQSIAHYRIISKLGEGGMGEVWRATDTKLGRDVAIKILPAAFAADSDRFARFTREAQVLASLNHPNIAAIYGVEERALVMELVDGPTLADRIARGSIPPDEALPIAKQITEALEYAHERRVIHRDLKPANIKVTPEGRVKVLDFGLAKAIAGDNGSPDSGHRNPMSSPTLTMQPTQIGTILGTAAYMAPEQARGQVVDQRADIWAFGVILYEMLSGRQLFAGPTVSDTLASVLKEQPEWDHVPRQFRKLLQLCLAKDPRRRLRDIGDAVALIEDTATYEPPKEVQVSAGRSRTLRSLAAALAVAAVIGWGLLWRQSRPILLPMMRFSADLGPDAVAGARLTVAISPDGSRIAYPVRAGGAILLATRRLDQSKATVLAGTEYAQDAFFSPDGQWIAFFTADKLKKVPVQGGAAVTLCDAPVNSSDRGGSWGDNGTIIATLDLAHLFRIPEAGGMPQMLSGGAGLANARWPQILPGGKNVLTTGGAVGGMDDAEIRVISLESGTVKGVVHGGYFGRYLPSGHLIYIHQARLYAVPFDLRQLEVAGQAVPIQEEIASNPVNGGGQLDFASGPSGHGTLVYLSGTRSASPISWMDGSGKTAAILPPSAAVAAFTPRLSPGGEIIAISVNRDIYTYDTLRGAMGRITFTSDQNRFPVWSPDGKHIVYAPATGGIWWTRADGSAEPRRILNVQGAAVPESFSPDGRRLAYFNLDVEQVPQISILPLDLADPDRPTPGTPELLVRSSAANVDPAFSPDGRWIAYSSTDSGPYQIYVRASTADGAAPSSGKWQVSTVPGRYPIWSRARKELFYQSFDGHIMAAEYTLDGHTFRPGTPRRWSETPIFVMPNRSLDLAPDGQRFVVFPAEDRQEAGSLHATVLLNFFDELKRRVSAN